MTPEKEVQNAIIDFLTILKKESKPLFFERRQAGGFSYKKGIPDLYAVYYGIHVEIEVKSLWGKQSTMQMKFEEKCKKLKIPYICADNVEQVKELLFLIEKRAQRLLSD